MASTGNPARAVTCLLVALGGCIDFSSLHESQSPDASASASDGGPGGACVPLTSTGWTRVAESTTWGFGPAELFSSKDRVYFVTGGGQIRIWDGAWNLATCSGISDLGTGCAGVEFKSGWAYDSGNASDVWVVGAGGIILHASAASGGRFANEPSGVTENLNAVWGTSPSDVYAVGNNGTIVHYAAQDGGFGWSKFDPTHAGCKFQTIWGTAANDFYIGGGGGANCGVLHYQNTPLTASIEATATGADVGVILGSSSGRVFAAQGTSGTIGERDPETGVWSNSKVVFTVPTGGPSKEFGALARIGCDLFVGGKNLSGAPAVFRWVEANRQWEEDAPFQFDMGDAVTNLGGLANAAFAGLNGQNGVFRRQ